MASQIKLCNGTIAEYDAEENCYFCTVEPDGRATDISLFCDPEDQNSVEAVKYTFSKLYEDWGRWMDHIGETLAKKVMPFFTDYGAQISTETFLEQYTPRKVEISYAGNVHIGRPQGNKVKVIFEEFDFDEDSFCFSISGTLEQGFDEVTMNDQPMSSAVLLKPHTLSNGEEVTYSNLLGAYETEIDFMGEDVEVFFTPNNKTHSADNAFDLFEKVYSNAEEFDIKARVKAMSALESRIDVLRRKFDDPELTVTGLNDELVPVILVFDSTGTMDFAYEAGSEDSAIRITVTGTEDGFTSVMIEDAEL